MTATILAILGMALATYATRASGLYLMRGVVVKGRLKAALDALPPKTQEVYRMSRFENLSGRDIATRMGLSEKSVEYHIAQSLKFLRTRLKDFIGVFIFIGLHPILSYLALSGLCFFLF